MGVGTLATALALFSGVVAASDRNDVAPGVSPCGRQCQTGGRILFDHPTWGLSELIVGWDRDSCEFAVLDGEGIERWAHRAGGCPDGAFPYASHVDAADNLFIGYTTGGWDAVAVLHVIEGGFDDVGSLPDVGVERFYDATIFDVDGDGDFEIVQADHPCTFDCVSDEASYRTFEWNGSDFFTELCTRAQRPPVPIQATPGPGGSIVGSIPAATCQVAANVVDSSSEVGWFAVWFDGLSGWAPVAAFDDGVGQPPWPPDANPYDAIPNVPPTHTESPPPPNQVNDATCVSYQPNDQYPIRRCDEGYAVLIIQQALVARGYVADVDNYFGPGTELAVREFQLAQGLDVDGLVGPRTWAALTGGGLPGYDTNGNGIIDPFEVIWD